MASDVSGRKIGAVLILTGFFLIAVLWEMDFKLAVTALSEANKLLFFPMVLCYFLGHTLRAVRLWILLEREQSFGRIFAIHSVGFLSINVMPLRMGELVRPYLLLEKEDVPISRSLAAVLLERLLDMSMLLILLLAVRRFCGGPKFEIPNRIILKEQGIWFCLFQKSLLIFE